MIVVWSLLVLTLGAVAASAAIYILVTAWIPILILAVSLAGTVTFFELCKRS